MPARQDHRPLAKSEMPPLSKSRLIGEADVKLWEVNGLSGSNPCTKRAARNVVRSQLLLAGGYTQNAAHRANEYNGDFRQSYSASANFIAFDLPV
jgi:hypothetical protein